MNIKSIIYTIIISAVVSVSVFIAMSYFTAPDKSPDVSISGNLSYLTGYEWLQLNNKSGNKIHLVDGKVIVTSPSFSWNGDTLATQKWVEDTCIKK